MRRASRTRSSRSRSRTRRRARCASGSSACSATPRAAIWILTFHAACGRILRREAQRLGYRSNFTIYDQADQVRLVKEILEDGGPTRSGSRRAASTPQISRAKNQLVGPDEYRAPRRLVLRPDRRRRLRALPAAPARLERGRLRRPALPHGRGARALPGGARALAEGVPLRPRRRVPGHEPRAVPAAAAAGGRSTGTSAPSATRISRSTPSAAPTSATSSSSSATSARRARSRSSRTTARRTRSCGAANERHRAQPRAEAEASSGPTSARASRCACVEVEDEHAEARFVAAEIAALVEEGFSRQRDRGLLPDERAVARARGRARPPGRSPTR